MDWNLIKDAGKEIVKFFSKNRGETAKTVTTVVITSSVTVFACSLAYKKLEKKHRKEDAERYKKEFKKRCDELEAKYKHNEYVLKKKINELCKDFGIDPVY
ncbi:hypothetical protein JQM83_06365 [Parabacteroides distasonis]|nr:hypothetical protein [Parabacteroides distasonis]